MINKSTQIGRKYPFCMKKGLIRLYQTYAFNMVEMRGFEPLCKTLCAALSTCLVHLYLHMANEMNKC